MAWHRRLATVVLAAICFGVVMAAIKGQGSGARDALGNISAPWLLVAFVGGASSRRARSAPLAGLAVTLAALAGFYAAESRLLDLGTHTWLVDLQLTFRAGRVYLLEALLSGPIFGALGGLWAKRRSALAAGVLAAMFVCEPLVVWLYQRSQSPGLSSGGSGLLTHYPWMWASEILVGIAGGGLVIAGGILASQQPGSNRPHSG
jgi:hypothetical protein